MSDVKITAECKICGESVALDSAAEYIHWSKAHDKSCTGPSLTQVPTIEWEALLAHHDQYHAGREFCVPNDDPLCSLIIACDEVQS